ncbi:hypothetical protein F8388_005437 [Cannabis sativa]|uniref:DUF4283 domain-containing protein n=1 Tax=Cannabis sativa TaxID=3483 RepID=A0A7J6H8R9_CANSA|nr:hypothetical protein F8388_005437 [Cannabis sativa]KAF4400675.1 hypothetical protein G4B88_023083 [Cannabis sativa]
MDPSGVCNLFEEAVQISQSDITFSLNPGEVDEPQESNLVLLGKIISRYKLGKSAIQGSLKLSWHSIKRWRWKEIDGGLIQFTFANRDDALNVLARRPWFVCGSLIVIMPWPSWLTPAEVRFDKTPIWVNVESIPPFYWNLSNLKEMASKASPVFELPQGIEDAVGLSSLRFRATIDLNQPIFSGFFLRRQKLKDLWIQYRYEKLPKICFKCGLLTHDQNSCFKAPTVVKDVEGNYYPMFGAWLKNDAHEKSTFTTPLAKWFQDWVLQKQLGRDPVLRNQMKIHKAIQHGESAEIRESRLQLPAKRRIVEDTELPAEESTNQKVIIQLPLVNLPGIGEIAPFGGNTKKAILPERKAPDTLTTSTATPANDGSMTTKQDAVLGEDKSNSMESHQTSNSKEQSVPLNSENETQATKPICTPFKNQKPNKTKVDLGPSYKDSPLGTQARWVASPSKQLWAQPKGRELLMGSLTIDKYHREPTLFNPILEIEDFRVYEHSSGPRKRKASDGILFHPLPNTVETNLITQETSTNVQLGLLQPPHVTEDVDNSIINAEFPPTNGATGYDLGNHNATPPTRRRGRPRTKSPLVDEAGSSKKRRGRPAKNKQHLGATPKAFKWQKTTRNGKEQFTTIKHHWEGNSFDLKVNLDNHFVVVEKVTKPNLNWAHYVPPIGQSGGLGLCWVKGVACNIISSTKFVIVGEISSDPPGIPWLLFGVYGPPRYQDKEAFWLALGDAALTMDVPIVVIGDLNGTLKDSECLNYANAGNSSRYAFDLRRMVNRVGLVDLGYQGPGFTWTKGSSRNIHSGRNCIKRARLDRGLATTDWRIQFPNAIVQHLSATVSDHRPILLDTTGGARCCSRLFKYENMWARDKRCFWVVKEAWAKCLHHNPQSGSPRG